MKKFKKFLKEKKVIIICILAFLVFGGGLYLIFTKYDIGHHGGRYNADNVIDCSFTNPYERDILSHHQIIGEDGKAHRAGLWRLNSSSQGSTGAYCAQYGGDLKKNTTYCRVELEDDNSYGFDAKHLRAVLTNSFPYLSVEEIRANVKKYLDANGKDSSWVSNLNVQEIMSGTQAAIWYYTKGISVTKLNQVVSYYKDLPKTIPSNYKFDNDYTKTLYRSKCANNDCATYVTDESEAKVMVDGFRDYLISLAGLDKKSVSVSEAISVISKNATYADGIYTYTVEFGVKNSKVTLKSSDITFYEDKDLTKKITDAKSETKGKNIVYTVQRKDDEPIYAQVTGTSTMIVPYFYYSQGVSYQSMINVAVKSINEKKTVTVDNKIGSVSISKKRATGSDELPGAKLVLKDKSGKVIEEWTSTKDPKVIHNLALGEYTLTEDAAPENCVKSTEEVTIIIKDNEIVSTEMRNKCSDSLTISKKELNGTDELPGAKLVLKDSNGTVIEEWTSTKTAKVIKGLEPGKYTLTETAAPENCKKASETMTIEITDKGNKISKTIYNKCSDTVVISKKKVSGTDELPGATLTLKDSKGTVVEEWVSTKTPKTIKGLEPGKYTLTEVKPPEYCLLSQETIEITITNAGKTFGKEMLNVCPDKYKISKRLITGGNELPGAKMQVLNSEGTVVDEWVSTVEPHMFGGFPAGEYTLVEKGAPDGCKLSKEEIKFTVTEEGVTNELEMLNACVPATGLSVKAIYYICGSLFLLLGVGLIIINKKKKLV